MVILLENGYSKELLSEHEPFQSENLGKYGKIFLEFKKYCSQQDIHFIATVYPNKHTIYEDKIPHRIRAIKKDTLQRIDQFFTYLEKSNISYVDHRNDILQQRDNEQLYLKNDSHWNARGAYIAYKNIIGALSDKDSSITPPRNIKKFELLEVENYLGGDLLSILGIDNSFGFFKDTYIKHPRDSDYLIRTKNVYGRGTLLIENRKSKNNKIAVFFGDSYSKELLKFLPIHFRKTIFIPNIRLDLNRVKDINPDILVYGIVERNLENFN